MDKSVFNGYALYAAWLGAIFCLPLLAACSGSAF